MWYVACAKKISWNSCETVQVRNGRCKISDEFVGFISLSNHALSSEEYDDAMRDLTNFFEYSGERNKLKCEQIGYWVIGFFLIFLILTILLKKEYWRDVH